MDTRILMEKDLETIVAFEKERLYLAISDPMERELAAWNARWRKEALDHYLPQGWSFGAFNNGQLLGYFLGQPYIFHRGLTQTLWIEHIAFNDAAAGKELMDVAHKWAKDKHLQTVLMENSAATAFVLESFPKAIVDREGLIELRSARF